MLNGYIRGWDEQFEDIKRILGLSKGVLRSGCDILDNRQDGTFNRPYHSFISSIPGSHQGAS